MRTLVFIFVLVTSRPFNWAMAAEIVDDESAFTKIFDGESLTGWVGEDQHWRVEGGAIVGEIPAGKKLEYNTWLVWENGKLDDFELRLQFRLSGKPKANSGIQFRCQVDNVNHVSGYQADMDLGATWLGRIYDEHGRGLLVERGTRVMIKENGERIIEQFAKPNDDVALFRRDNWNDYRIRACGEHITVEINGSVFSELVDRQDNQKDLSGRLAFQLHAGPETKVQFRNSRYRKLKPGEHRIEFNTQRKNGVKKKSASREVSLNHVPRYRQCGPQAVVVVVCQTSGGSFIACGAKTILT